MIVGGMTFGTMLTLFVVPCVYSVMGRRAPRLEPVAVAPPRAVEPAALPHAAE